MPSSSQMRAARELGNLTHTNEPLRPGRRPPPKALSVPEVLLLGKVEPTPLPPEALEAIQKLQALAGDIATQALRQPTDGDASRVDDPAETVAHAIASSGLAEEQERVVTEVLAAVERLRWTNPDGDKSTFAGGLHRPCMHDFIAPGAADATVLKVALLLLWIGRHQPDGLLPEAPAALYAEALGLPDPDTRGARRVREAQKRLADLHLIARRSRRPRATELRLINIDGAPFPSPTREHDALVPSTLFTSGWIAALGGPAVVALIHIVGQRLGHHRGRRPGATELRRRSGLSKAAWYSGIDELLNYGLLSRRQFDQSRSADRYFGRRRYDVLSAGLGREAPQWKVTEWRTRQTN